MVIHGTPYRQVGLVFQVLIHTPFDYSDYILYNTAQGWGRNILKCGEFTSIPYCFFLLSLQKIVDLHKHDSWATLSKPGIFKHLN